MAGGGGDNAMTVLKSRAVAGNPRLRSALLVVGMAMHLTSGFPSRLNYPDGQGAAGGAIINLLFIFFNYLK